MSILRRVPSISQGGQPRYLSFDEIVATEFVWGLFFFWSRNIFVHLSYSFFFFFFFFSSLLV